MSEAKVVSVNISKEKGTIKKPAKEIKITKIGIVSDAHAGDWHRQVSMLASESIIKFSREMKKEINFGEFAENITTEGIDLTKISLLDRVKIGSAEFEVTQIGKKCHGDGCAIFREVGQCVMPKEGIFMKVIKGGKIVAGSTIIHEAKKVKILVLTLSDRASQGEYEDLSGPQIISDLKDFFKDKTRQFEIEYTLIPDDEKALKNVISNATKEGLDFVFSTGGTGISEKDITPDVLLKFPHKNISGIMDFVRIKYGEKNPNALLSRSVALVIKNTIIYAMPGSVKAVKEYMQEILKTLGHTIEMKYEVKH